MYQQGYRPSTKQSRPPAKGAYAKRLPPVPAPQDKPASPPVMQGYSHTPSGAMVKNKKHKSGSGRVLFLLLALGVLAFGAFYLKTWLEVRPYDSLFVPNVFVDNIPMGGMTAQEGIAAFFTLEEFGCVVIDFAGSYARGDDGHEIHEDPGGNFASLAKPADFIRVAYRYAFCHGI